MKEVAKASRHPSDVSEHKRSICESNIHNPVLGRTTADVLKKDSMERTMLSVLDASTSNGHRDDPHWENVPRKSTTGSTMLFDGSVRVLYRVHRISMLTRGHIAHRTGDRCRERRGHFC